MLEKIHRELIEIKDRPGIPPNDPLNTATEHGAETVERNPNNLLITYLQA